ncbi:MAG: peroxiredoxin [Rhodobacteraceae bacterium]|nr:peroxiredoxin [Paracoccaceae bacterium]
MISTGDTLPEANFLRMGAEGPEAVALSALTAGRKVVIFGLPGAFTGTCTTAHVPSFIKNREALAAQGVEEVICLSVNDPFVMAAWSDATGAAKGGVTMLGDADGSYTAAIGLGFDAPPAGLIGRSQRYAMLVENGVVTQLNIEAAPGTCDLSGAETLLGQL